ncbi:hypothetical protein SLE2022_140430 [Rubroshorea leprosula]
MADGKRKEYTYCSRSNDESSAGLLSWLSGYTWQHFVGIRYHIESDSVACLAVNVSEFNREDDNLNMRPDNEV